MNTTRNGTTRGLLQYTIMFLAISTVSSSHLVAQTRAKPIPRGTLLPTKTPQQQTVPPRTNVPTQPTPQPEQAEEEIVVEIVEPGVITKALMGQKFKRTHETIFQAKQDLELDPLQALPPILESEDGEIGHSKERVMAIAEQYGRIIHASRWDLLAALMTEADVIAESRQIRNILLKQLSADKVLSPTEVLEFALLTDAAMDDEEIRLMAKMLAQSLKLGSKEALLELVDAGHAGIGGEDQAQRNVAADLLVQAGLHAEAHRFLQPIPDEDPDPELLNRHGFHHQHVGLTSDNPINAEKNLSKAWKLYLQALESERIEPDVRNQVLDRLFTVAPRVPGELRREWFANLFKPGNPMGTVTLSRLGANSMTNYKKKSTVNQRVATIRQLKQIVDIYRNTPGMDPENARNLLNLLATAINQEAALSIKYDPSKFRTATSSRPIPIPRAQLASMLPEPEWLDLIDPIMAEQIASNCCIIAAHADDTDLALRYLEWAKRSRQELLDRMAGEFLGTWAGALNPRSQTSTSSRTSYNNTFVNISTSAPITRAKQIRSLRRLADILATLKEMGVENLDDEIIVKAFTQCHSNAEVFQAEDIINVLGPMEQLDPMTSARLAGQMQTALNTTWRSEKTQEQAGTRRTDQEIRLEVERGYSIVIDLLEAAIESEPDRWQLQTQLGQALFDLAEFKHQADPSLETYVPLREAAFASFRKGAELYNLAMIVETEKPSARPFLNWYLAALGATELGFLTRNTQPENDQIHAITQSIDSMPGNLASIQKGIIARAVVGQISKIRSDARQRYLEHARRMVDGHADAVLLEQVTDLYRELGEEVQLTMELDGDTSIGTDPFGVIVSLRYTNALERESGGFRRYLSNSVYNQGTRAQVDYRDRFEDRINDTLSEPFEVLGIQFHEPNVKSRGFGRPGWAEVPFAYVLMKARDESVDTIPPLQLDMDFGDGHGLVQLPVLSQPILVDATGDQSARPLRDLSIDMVLDDRELDEQVVRLEVRADARGIVPELDALLADLDSLEGWTVTDVQDNGLNLIDIDEESLDSTPVSERSWVITLAPLPGDAASTFVFPAPTDDSFVTSHRRYADMDIIPVSGPVSLDPWLLPRDWTWIILATIILVILITGSFLFMKARSDDDASQDQLFVVPSHVTPLNAIALLSRIARSSDAHLDAAARADLDAELDALQKQCFGPGQEAMNEDELGRVVSRWVARATG